MHRRQITAIDEPMEVSGMFWQEGANLAEVFDQGWRGARRA